jgi:hypothetical protein
MLIEPEADRPHLLLLQSALGSEQPALVPGTAFLERRVQW